MFSTPYFASFLVDGFVLTETFSIDAFLPNSIYMTDSSSHGKFHFQNELVFHLVPFHQFHFEFRHFDFCPKVERISGQVLREICAKKRLDKTLFLVLQMVPKVTWEIPGVESQKWKLSTIPESLELPFFDQNKVADSATKSSQNYFTLY